MDYIMAMDVGGTKGRLVIRSVQGVVLGEFDSPGWTLQQDGVEGTTFGCSQLILPALEKLGLRAGRCRFLCCGAAGVEDEASARTYERILSGLGLPAERVLAANDCQLFLLEDEIPSVLIASGTGSAIWARGHEGEMARYGGWGNHLSDEGSACWLVQRSLEYAVRQWDALTPAVLNQLLAAEAGITSPLEAEAFVRGRMTEKSHIAALAPLVSKAAAQGDSGVLRIYERGAQALAEGAVLLAKRLDLHEPTVFLWGSVLLNVDFLQMSLSAILKERLGVTPIPVKKSALEVCLQIAERRVKAKGKLGHS